MTGNAARTLYSDGACNSESNRAYATANGIDLVLIGVQGKPSRFELENDTLTVTDKKTGKTLPAEKRGDKWRICITGKRVCYRCFTEEYLKRVTERKHLQEILQEKRNKRNNVEATIFQNTLNQRSFFALKALLWVYIERFRRIIGFKDQEGDNSISFRPCHLKRMVVAFV